MVATFTSTCNQEDEGITTIEKLLAKNAAMSFSFTIVAANANHDYNDQDNSASYSQRTDCPEVHWYGICSWLIDYGPGCYGPLGNYFSGSFS